MLRSFSFCRERAVVFCARALLGFGLDVERERDLPRERERPERDGDHKGDVRCAGEEGVPAVEAERDHAECGCDTDIDGVSLSFLPPIPMISDFTLGFPRQPLLETR